MHADSVGIMWRKRKLDMDHLEEEKTRHGSSGGRKSDEYSLLEKPCYVRRFGRDHLGRGGTFPRQKLKSCSSSSIRTWSSAGGDDILCYRKNDPIIRRFGHDHLLVGRRSILMFITVVIIIDSDMIVCRKGIPIIHRCDASG
jgi:hypothetical protein